ncbi:hypothetical protein BABINDRAFT_37759 [Babjeviella inositovora NRRL Y-12698]|uniref:Histone deacetylase n=1 Tax=Babjeviella inositovora NRRL Y-12698 TaxID=984486 RepID=A0A1E3QNI4_9ASCO|nr:uncharacterized protein BABINDRAFT_37759 [Babjeviella inositovora NRRL Y-12698]ODQ79266.1 hypothetical protein BABINDRAFT_37759 [Babjeviella inositovora NRRL Y-12698]
MSDWDESTLQRDIKTEGHAPTYTKLYNATYNPRVSYHYNPDVSKYHYGVRHPMKPFRLMLTDQLVISYKLHEQMDLYYPRRATKDELTAFHSEDYVDFLRQVTPDNSSKYLEALREFNIGDDCPVFDGMYDYSSIYAGALLDATRKLISGTSDIAINWSGGLHHAKRTMPSGFCYVNDIVLSILNLLRVHPRVLYIDIDIHHGDGVQEAFYTTDRVMTVSFHKYNGEFFPGTGNFDEIGVKKGKHYSVNVPLRDGIDDDSYIRLFKSVMEPLITSFQPSVIVQQCGADSLGGDRLGCFNLNIKAHAECVKFVKSFGLPMLVLGGGGYTPRNVSRLWCYETSVITDVQLEGKQVPSSVPFRSYFAKENYLLHPYLGERIDNKNTKKYLESVRIQILEQLRFLNGAPSVSMSEIPPDIGGITEEEEQALRELNEEMEVNKNRSEGGVRQLWDEKDEARKGELVD